MGKEKISVTVDKEVWQKFYKYCQDNGYSLSGRIEVLIKQDLSGLKKKEEIRNIIREMVLEKEQMQEHSVVYKAGKKKSNDVTNLSGLTERYLNMKKERVENFKKRNL